MVIVLFKPAAAPADRYRAQVINSDSDDADLDTAEQMINTALQDHGGNIDVMVFVGEQKEIEDVSVVQQKRIKRTPGQQRRP